MRPRQLIALPRGRFSAVKVLDSLTTHVLRKRTLAMFSGITITCFAASYAVSLVLEVSRLFFRAAIRIPIIFAFGAAGLLAHTLYLVARVQAGLSAHGVSPLSSWYDFCLIVAWILAGTYLAFGIRRPHAAIGIFLLPLVLLLIGVGALFRQASPFRSENALYAWRFLHGFSLLTGTVTVALGFALGLMYLTQAYRLKHKVLPRRGLQLPSLEWLQRANRESLAVSTCLLTIGLICGVILNLIRPSENGPTVSWSDPVVLSSGVLFAWLTVMTVFESVYRPARQGTKVAYLTLASFVLFGLALYFVLFGAHGVQ